MPILAYQDHSTKDERLHSMSPEFRPQLLLFFKAHQHKAAGIKIKLSKNNDHDWVSHGVKCSQEGDRIPPLESNGPSLEQEHRLSCAFPGCSDASANFLDQLNGGLVPGASSLNCHWKKDVRGRQRAILYNLVVVIIRVGRDGRRCLVVVVVEIVGPYYSASYTLLT